MNEVQLDNRLKLAILNSIYSRIGAADDRRVNWADIYADIIRNKDLLAIVQFIHPDEWLVFLGERLDQLRFEMSSPENNYLAHFVHKAYQLTPRGLDYRIHLINQAE